MTTTDFERNKSSLLTGWRRRVAAPLAAAILAAGLSGCVTDGNGGPGLKQSLGALGGAALGGWAGSKVGGGRGQLAAVAVGALAGGLLGNSIGTSLDRADQLYAAKAQNAAMTVPDGATVSWSNPNSGNYGTVTPVRTTIGPPISASPSIPVSTAGALPAPTAASGGTVCREYHTTVHIGGGMEEAYGTACRMPDGSWKMSGSS